MNNLNSILIEGNLTQDPELNVVASGKSVCRFSIATNRYYRNAEKALVSEVTYVDIDTWGSLAEGCAKYLHKGRGARIVGRLKQERWQGDDNRMHERYVVVAEHVEFHPESQRENPAPVAADGVVEPEEETGAEPESMVFEEPPKSRKAKNA
jgi:single-strand DNA-binding protein